MSGHRIEMRESWAQTPGVDSHETVHVIPTAQQLAPPRYQWYQWIGALRPRQVQVVGVVSILGRAIDWRPGKGDRQGTGKIRLFSVRDYARIIKIASFFLPHATYKYWSSISAWAESRPRPHPKECSKSFSQPHQAPTRVATILATNLSSSKEHLA